MTNDDFAQSKNKKNAIPQKSKIQIVFLKYKLFIYLIFFLVAGFIGEILVDYLHSGNLGYSVRQAWETGKLLAMMALSLAGATYHVDRIFHKGRNNFIVVFTFIASFIGIS